MTDYANCFPSWDSSIHTQPDQVKRMINGAKIKDDDIILSDSFVTGTFFGSSGDAYEVTLESCDCMDFKQRGKPCKHMYRLAMEFGELPPFPSGSRGGKKAAEEMAANDLEKWKTEFEAGNISPAKYVKIAEALLSK